MAWHNPFQVWLTESQQLENAQQVVNFLYTEDKDWSKESIAALIGNMSHESSINPNMYEYGYDWEADRGFGLVQWTPRSKYWNWGVGKGYTETQLRSGNAQLARIDYEVDNNIQWIPKDSNYNGLTFKQFRTNSQKLSVSQLTEAFMWGYERPASGPGSDSLPARQAFANKAFNNLKWEKKGGTDPDPKPDPEPDPEPKPPEIDFSGILKFFTDFGKDIVNKIEKMLIVNLFDYGKSRTFGNCFLRVDKTFANTYKIKPTLNFDKAVDDIIKKGKQELEKIIEDLKPKDPDPGDGGGDDGGSEPSGDMYFPVNINQPGVNFWVKENHPVGSIQNDMGYGKRASGEFHSGYDIGTGGNAGYKAYAIRDCTITDIRQVTGGGYSIFMKHETDKYHSMFLHLQQDSAVVKVGDKVKAGQQVAVIGNTGGNYPIHLHVEISPTGAFHNEANTINPQTYLKVTGDNKTSLKIPK